MQVICPWCQTPVAVEGAAAGDCPQCGKALVPRHRFTFHGLDTVSEPHRPLETLAVEEEPLPRVIGRYRIINRVGRGGFGSVYKGYDEELYREVAVKVPHRHRLLTPDDVAAYREEARTLARLDHPGIVEVYDIGQTDAGAYYLVSQFIDGSDLAHRIAAGGLTPADAARIVARVADALHHAHERGLIHRDIKPGNILLDAAGKPFVTDFGLARHEEDIVTGPTFAGTPIYMSPEQARGEGHRVDRRTDVYSLGVVFYEMLTQRPPFQGETVEELLEQITSREVQPPRQLNEAVPAELERICLKALSKRASDRYGTVQEMAEDLDHWLSSADGEPNAISPSPLLPFSPSPEERAVKVVPKGLRSFDQRDAEFFLELVPGPRDRDGLPNSLRFWKTRIESMDPASAFTVGLIYGPSGCGKSSLVRAGLLPRLAAHVSPVYVEAAREGTERRILGGLWHLFPDLTGEVDLPSLMTALRRGRTGQSAQGLHSLRPQLSAGRKLIVIIDQFEQFLHGNGDRLASSQLVAALRQADGARVQFLLSLREDFWLAGQRLFQELEIPLIEGQNMELIDLFDPLHARRVLTLFGRAHGRLPDREDRMSAEQRLFLDQAVTGLSEDGKVIPVRLSLFAEMMKNKPWTPQSLQAIGGPQGVGLAFLEDNFPSGKQARGRPDRKAMEKPARRILAALLPGPGSDIKGQIRSVEELQQASGLKASPHRFDRLLDLLDRDLRIITPAEPPPAEGETSPTAPTATTAEVRRSDGRGQFYQLTHDFLVPPLREWLTLRKRATFRGRAELALHERSSQWNRSPEDRYLPTFVEYVNVFLFVPPIRRKPEEHAVMKAASWFYGRIALVVVVLAGLLGWWWFESTGRSQAQEIVTTIENADIGELPRLIDQNLPRLRRWADNKLRRVADAPRADQGHRLRAMLALLESDPHRVEQLELRMLDCSTKEFRVIRDRIVKSGLDASPFFWPVLHDAAQSALSRFRAGVALATFAPGDPQWRDDDFRLIAQQLLVSSRDEQADLRDMLKPIAGRLLEPLQDSFKDEEARLTVRIAAADALADYCKEDVSVLSSLVEKAHVEQKDVLNAALRKVQGR